MWLQMWKLREHEAKPAHPRKYKTRIQVGLLRSCSARVHVRMCTMCAYTSFESCIFVLVGSSCSRLGKPSSSSSLRDLIGSSCNVECTWLASRMLVRIIACVFTKVTVCQRVGLYVCMVVELDTMMP